MKISKPMQFACAAVVAAICAFAVIPPVLLSFKNRKSKDDDSTDDHATTGKVWSEPQAPADTVSPTPVEQPQRSINLVLNTPVVLTADGQGGDERFAQAFRKTWDHIPEFETAVILAFWDKCREEGSSPVPLIEVVPGTQTPEQSSPDGCHLRFAASEVEKISDDVLEVWIAHELAQVSLIAKGMDEDDDEDLMAKEILTTWRFDALKLPV
jgi:hypothetical protein